jgi:uncharacterized protein (DUF433 family)
MTLPVILVPHPHVRADANVLGGSPYVLGTRVPVRRLYAFYQSGVNIETLLRRFPQIGPAKVFDALAFALDNPEVMEADMAHEREMLERVGHKRPARPRGAEQIELPFAATSASVADGGRAPKRSR